MTFGQKSRANVAAVKRWNTMAIRWLSSHSSIGNGGLMLLVISSAIFVIYFVKPTVIFNQEEMTPTNLEETTIEYNILNSAREYTWELLLKEKRILEESVKQCREEAKILLENETENHRQMKATLTATLELCKKQQRQVNMQTTESNKHNEGVKNATEMVVTVDREFFNYMATYLHNTPYPGVENYSRYAVARLGLIPLTNTIQLKPEFGPVINDVLSFDYPITIPICGEHTFNRTVFIAINSAPDNFERRNTIRNSWSHDLQTENEKGWMLDVAGFAFVLGQTDNNLTQRRIEEESRTYGDIIQIGMSDFYRNLSFKVAGLFNWLYRNCGKVDFVFKVDDDVYVNVRNLADFLQHHQPSNQTMFGTLAGGLTANRNGKWNITLEEWPWKQYPPYFFGPAVLISGTAIVPLLAAMQTTPMMPFDDVYYTAICTEKAGVTLHFSSSENSVLMMQPPAYCALGGVIAWITNNQTLSHLTTTDFYQNTTHNCTASGVNGTI